MSNYVVTVKDVAARSQIIAKKCTDTPQKEPFYQYVAGPIDLPVIQIELNLPVYRLENYRTQTRQEKIARERQLGADFFRHGQENVSAQQAQHEILLQFAKEGSGESIIPIYDVLRGGKTQNEPLLLTREGIVVNGNRRLAAMRDLYTLDPGAYAGFGSVRARVLPAGLTAVEIKRIETRLQMTPQTLLPYDWVNEALAIRDLRALGLSDREIATEMKLDDPDQVGVLLERLNEGELYLSEHLKVKDHERIIPHKQQFIELQKALDGIDDAVQKELARRICYVLTDNADKLGRRVYDYRIAYGSELKSVVDELSERLGVAPDSESEPTPAPAADLFDDGSGQVEPYAPLLERLDDLTQTAVIANEITDICENIRESKRAQDVSQAALKNIKKANTLLQETSVSAADPATFVMIKAQLQSIESRAKALANAIAERESGK